MVSNKRGNGLATFEIDGSADEENAKKLQRRHSFAVPRERRRNSAPSPTMKLSRFLSHEGPNASSVEEWKSCNNIKTGKGTECGRVKVFVRIRALSGEESGKESNLPFQFVKEEAQISLFPDEKSSEKTFKFDHIFTPDEDNQQVCNTLTEPLIQSAMSGFNGTMMAYGQTSSGKTYTLMSCNGITQSLVDKCFARIQGNSKHTFKVTISYLQIYQEKIFDLLKEGSENIELAIRENPHHGIYVENLTEYVVRSPTEVHKYIAKGQSSLMFSETKMNQCSSRSHAVLQMTIEQAKKEDLSSTEEDDDEVNEEEDENESKDKISKYLDSFGKDVIIRGKIHICDLAGSERIKRAGDDRLSETQAINSSLLELGNVIQALADEKATHVPYRNSILTRLLQESLGGNCKTGLIICISPSPEDFQETKCSLNFGQRARKVRNKAYINMEVDYKKLSEHLMKQIDAKETEMRKIMLANEIGNKCESSSLQKRLDDTKRESESSIKLQNELHIKELEALQEEIFVLNEQVCTHKEQIADCESSMHVTSDVLTGMRNTLVEFLRTEKLVNTLFEKISSCDAREQLSLLKSFYKLLLMTCKKIKTHPNQLISDMILKEYLSMFREKLENIQVEALCVEVNNDNINEMKGLLDRIRKEVHDENMVKLDGIEEDKTSDSGIDDDKLTDTELNRLRYKMALKSFVILTANSLELLHVRLNSEKYKEETEKLSYDFHGYKSTKDLLFKELSKARKEERDCLSKENGDLRLKIGVLKKTIEENKKNDQTSLESEHLELLTQFQKLEVENTNLTSQFQNYKLTTESSLTQMEKSRRAEKDDLSKEMNEEISRLQRENNELLSRIREYTTTIKEQGSEIVTLNHTIANMEHDVKEIRSKIKSYGKRMDEERNDLKLHGEQQESSTQVNETKSLSKEKEHEMNSLKVKMTDMEAEIDVLQSKIETLEKNEADKTKEILKLQAERQESINKISKSTSTTIEKETEIKNLNIKVENMEAEMGQLQSKIGNFEEQVNEKKEEIAKLQKEHYESLNQAGECINTLSKEKEAVVCELNHKMTSIEMEVAELQSKINILEKKVEDKKIEISRLQREHRKALNRVSNSSSTIEQENEIKNLNVMVAKTEVENEQLRSKIKVFERKVVDKENEIMRMQKEYNDGHKQVRESVVSEFETSVTNKANEIKQLTVKVTKMASKNKELLSKIKDLNKREEDRENKIITLQEEHDDLITQIDESLSTDKERDLEFKNINLKIVEMETESTNLQEELSVFKESEEVMKNKISMLRKDYEESIKNLHEYSSIMETKESEIETLNDQIAEIEEENVKLHSKIFVSEKNEDDNRKEIVRLQKEHNESLIQIRECSSTVKERKTEIASMNQKIMNMEVENESLHSKVKVLERREEENKNEIAKLYQERNDSVTEVREYVSTVKEKENEISYMTDKIMQIEIENEELRSKIEMFEQKEEDDKKKIAKLKKHEDSFTSTVNKKENEIKSLSIRLTNLEDANEELHSKINMYVRRDEKIKNETMLLEEEREREIKKVNTKLTEIEMENRELCSKIKVLQEVIEENKKKEIQQNQTILDVQNAHHGLWKELESCRTRMAEKENILKKMDPEITELKNEKHDLHVKLEAYKQIIEQKDREVEDMENRIRALSNGYSEYFLPRNKTMGGDKEGASLHVENAKLLSEMASYKAANEEVHEEVAKLTLENSNLLSQFDCFLSAVNKKERLCKKLAAKVCDLEAINEKLFETISQSIYEDDGEYYLADRGYSEGGLRINLRDACKEEMKDLLADTIIEQEERLVAEITTENVYDSTLQRSERISINTSTFNVSRRGKSDKSLMSSVYNTLKSAEKAQLNIKEKLSEVEHEKSELDNKCKHLESSIEKLRNEKLEFHNLILELTQSSSRDGKHHDECHRDDQRNVTNDKIKVVDNCCQTDDLSSHHGKSKSINTKSKRALKVAHIKPLVNFETDTDNSIMDFRDTLENTKDDDDSISRDDFNVSRDDSFSPLGSPCVPRRETNTYTDHRVSRNNDNIADESSSSRAYSTIERNQAPPRYSSVPSKEKEEQDKKRKRNSGQYSDGNKGNSTYLPSSTKDYEARNKHNGKSSKEYFGTPCNHDFSSKYIDDKVSESSKLRSSTYLSSSAKDCETRSNNHGKKSIEYREDKEKSSMIDASSNGLPFNYTDGKVSTVSKLKSTACLSNSTEYYEARDKNYGTTSSEYLEKQEKRSMVNASIPDWSSKYTTDEVNEIPILKSSTCLPNSTKDYEDRNKNFGNNSSEYLESREKSSMADASVTESPSKHLDDRINEDLKLKSSTYTSSSSKDHDGHHKNYTISSNVYIDNSGMDSRVNISSTDFLKKYTPDKINESSKLKPSSECSPTVTDSTPCRSMGSSASYNEIEEKKEESSIEKVTTRYGIDLSTIESPPNYQYASHYDSIIHKYDKFLLPSKW